MSKISEIRTSIDQTLDRWEDAAFALEESIGATQAAVSERLQTQKEKAAETSEKLKQVVHNAQQLPSEAREQIVASLDHLKVQLALGKAEAHDAILAQQQKIGQAVEQVERQIDQIEEQVGQEFDKAAKEWVRANMEVKQQLSLAALRFENEKTDKQAQFAAKKEEMLSDVKQFQESIQQKRDAALEKGSEFSSEMNASFEQAKRAFQNLLA